MEARILTYNFRGMSSIEDRLLMRNFIANQTPSLDFISGQEHKIRVGKINELQSIWPTTEFFSALAHDGTHARRNHRVIA